MKYTALFSVFQSGSIEKNNHLFYKSWMDVLKMQTQLRNTKYNLCLYLGPILVVCFECVLSVYFFFVLIFRETKKPLHPCSATKMICLKLKLLFYAS